MVRWSEHECMADVQTRLVGTLGPVGDAHEEKSVGYGEYKNTRQCGWHILNFQMNLSVLVVGYVVLALRALLSLMMGQAGFSSRERFDGNANNVSHHLKISLYLIYNFFFFSIINVRLYSQLNIYCHFAYEISLLVLGRETIHPSSPLTPDGYGMRACTY